MKRLIRKESSPLTDVLEAYDEPESREAYIALNYLGEVGTDEFIPHDVEATFPVQFRRRTLMDITTVIDKTQ